MKIKLTPTQSKFLREQSSVIVLPNGDTWYYFPFWWHPEGKNVFDQVDLDQLPQEVKGAIITSRDPIEDAIKKDNRFYPMAPNECIQTTGLNPIMRDYQDSCQHDPAVKNSENGLFQRYCRKCGDNL